MVLERHFQVILYPRVATDLDLEVMDTDVDQAAQRPGFIFRKVVNSLMVDLLNNRRIG